MDDIKIKLDFLGLEQKLSKKGEIFHILHCVKGYNNYEFLIFSKPDLLKKIVDKNLKQYDKINLSLNIEPGRTGGWNVQVLDVI